MIPCDRVHISGQSDHSDQLSKSKKDEKFENLVNSPFQMRVVGNLYKTLLCQSKQNQHQNSQTITEPDSIIMDDKNHQNHVSLNIPPRLKPKKSKRPISQAFHALDDRKI